MVAQNRRNFSIRTPCQILSGAGLVYALAMKKKPSAGHGLSVVGFECPPVGQLLTQFVDFDHAQGVAYERVIGYDKDFHIHDRLNLAFPRGSSIVLFTLPSGEKFPIDESTFLWMPANVSHRQDVKTTIYDNLALFPDETAIAEAVAQRSRIQKIKSLPEKTLKATRSALLKELLDRFFFERVLRRTGAALLASLGTQILEEAVRIVTGERAAPRQTSEPAGDDTAVLRAVQYLESNLFSAIDTTDLARAARASQATLFRQFRRATGVTPGAYLRRRRLEEARRLLQTGQYSVSDVALLVGYEDLPAFSKAFKREFGVSPSLAR